MQDDVKEDDLIKERMQRIESSNDDPYESFRSFAYPRKSKIIAGLLAFIIPGTGHFYLGLMEKGLLMMLLVIFDIVGITYFAVSSFSIPLIVLLSLVLPVIYFYNIFDALQSTDIVNARLSGLGEAEMNTENQRFKGLSRKGDLGWFLIIGGILFFLVSSKPVWISELFDWFGSYFGAIILILMGIFLFIKEARK